MPHVKSIHHMAVVVGDMEGPLEFWRDALGMEVREIKDVPGEGSKVAFLPAGESLLELVMPTQNDSGVARYLSRRGPGMHHVCLEVDDLTAMLGQLKSRGIRLINEEPQQTEDGPRYAFIHPEATGGVLVELYET
jgi:methylmalonyl-CoA/ethylmalonyl-CoA epimerase